MRASLLRSLAVAATALSLSACGGTEPVETSTVPDEPQQALVSSTTSTTSTTVTLAPVDHSAAREVAPEPEPGPQPLDPGGVVAAVVVIAGGGDLEAAILDGVVSEAEAEAALAALEHGTLDELLAAD